MSACALSENLEEKIKSYLLKHGKMWEWQGGRHAYILRLEISNFKFEEIILAKSLGIRIKIRRSPMIVLRNLIRVGENNLLSVPA